MKIFRQSFFFLNAILPIKKQTFTYFIPAPPIRKTGYREKGYDNIVKELVDIGFRIIQVKPMSISENDRLGMWIVLTVAPFTEEAFKLNPSNFPNEFSDMVPTSDKNDSINQMNEGNKTTTELELPIEENDNNNTDKIDGIYYIDSENS